MDNRPGGFAAGYDEPARPLFGKAAGNCGECLLDQCAGAFAADDLLDRGDLLGRRGRADQDWPIAEPTGSVE